MAPTSIPFLAIVLFCWCISEQHAFQPPTVLVKSKQRQRQILLDASVAVDHKIKRSNATSINSSSRLAAVVAIWENRDQQNLFPMQKLNSSPFYRQLNYRNRSFAKLLVLTATRRMGQIDKVITSCLYNGKARNKDRLVTACLRIGAAQTLFTDVAIHAAVKETVDVLRLVPGRRVPESKVKFVNAVLRRVAEKGRSMLNETSPCDNLAPWLLDELRDDWGDDKAVKVAEAMVEEAPTCLTINHPAQSTEEERRQLEQKISATFKGRVLPQGSIQVPLSGIKGDIRSWPHYNEGLWWIQDPSATVPALALKSAFQGQDLSKLHVVDMCAAPGGKTCQLASFGFSHVTAVEKTQRRGRRLTDNLERTNLRDRCSIVTADGTTWVPGTASSTNDDTTIDDDDTNDVAAMPAAGILLDVPCSATGTGKKQPNVLRRDKSLGNNLEVQEKLANHCADSILDVGGIMVYSTCSVLKRESEDQVHRLLARPEGSKLETVPFEPGEIPGFDNAIDENGWLRVLPGCHDDDGDDGINIGGFDGFFVARLRKVA